MPPWATPPSQDHNKTKRAVLRAYGAEVILYDRATEDRDAIGARLTPTELLFRPSRLSARVDPRDPLDP